MRIGSTQVTATRPRLSALAAALLALLASCVVVVIAGLRRLSLEPRAVA